MANIAILGPNEPFSERAVDAYRETTDEIDGIKHFPSINEVYRSIGAACDYACLPLESMIHGYTVSVLELLLQSNCVIIDELFIPITYGLAAGCGKTSAMRTLYTTYQSVAECADFLASLRSVNLVRCEDAREALQKASAEAAGSGALIPSHLIPAAGWPLVMRNVNDYPENTTRFIVVAEQEQPFQRERSYKTSMVILETDDRPGVLRDILHAFSSRSINLTSIISRPTREHLGRYHFFIDCSAYVLSAPMKAALADIKNWGHIKLLGSYPAAETPAPTAAVELPDCIASLRENPLKPAARAPRIAVASGKGPYRNTLDALAAFDLSPVAGKRVLLKPNIGRIAAPDSGVVTNPQVIAAVIDAFRAAGAADVAVGESPITGVDMEQAYEKAGVSSVAEERNCRCIDMDERDPVSIAVRDGTAVTSLKICADVFDFDFIVSIPVMKTHMHTVVTLSVKNMKGCLWRRSKIDLHMLPRVPFSDDKSLNIAITDLSALLRPHLVIIDGTVGMEGLGPSAGEPKPLDLVVAGDDAFAADSVACYLMGLDPRAVPHLRIAEERGYANLDTGTFTITPPGWRSLEQKFAAVPDNLSIQFPKARILDEQSCSACQSSVLLFMKRYAAQLDEYFPGDKKVTIAIGKGHNGIPPNTICVGNCTRRFRDTGIYVPGCPPVASSILSILEKQKTADSKD